MRKKEGFKVILMKKIGLSLATLLGVMSTALAYKPTKIEVTPPTGSEISGLTGAVGKILGAAQWIGFIVGTAMIIYIGIKYLTAGAGQKAEVKSTMVPLLVGAVLVMLAPTIAHWIFGLVGSN